MASDILVEACVESAESAIAAEQGGADRVELCGNLIEGGTTPSEGAMVVARARLSIPIHAMIRPRGGDFCYTPTEQEIMVRDIDVARRTGMDGVVLGVLEPYGGVDLGLLRRLVHVAQPMTVTFHRAFDVCRDPETALQALVDTGIDRLLTSGQHPDVVAGADTIRRLVELAHDRICVMPGGGVTPGNIETVLKQTGAQEIHVYAPREFRSPMTWQNPAVLMGDMPAPDEYRRVETDAALVRSLVDAARTA